MQEAIEDSGLSESQISNERTGIIAGSGGASSENLVQSAETLREKASSESERLWFPEPWGALVSRLPGDLPFKIKGLNYPFPPPVLPVHTA